MSNEEGTGRRIILADGDSYENAEAGYHGGYLAVFMKRIVTLQEAAVIFFNTAKTAAITFEYGPMEDRYEGYTHVSNLCESADGNVTVTLRRPE